ncbi:hypothetical protein [Nocardioides jejuensis]|uniref:Uncharacterized protein n=1 Tax=Nocardioides jejuensis TaxID=2502782 RepID=A0A4R1CLE8_9ACTN|nr:hypothetical protein [Nocardioides jejuensis]TCJ31046.1 hypothetical protein EPD65_00265 [Nocardioides jejuensis]
MTDNFGHMGNGDWISRSMTGILVGMGCAALPFVLFAAVIVGVIAAAITGSTVIGWFAGVGVTAFMIGLLAEGA